MSSSSASATVNFESETITLGPDGSGQLVFSNSVQSYAVGLQNWLFQFNDCNQHQIRAIGLQISATQNTKNPNVVDVSLKTWMDDNSNHSLNTLTPIITVCGIAATSPTPLPAGSDFVMGNMELTDTGQLSQGTFNMPGDSGGVPTCFLSGFGMAFGRSTDHNIETIEVSQQLSVAANGYALLATAGMCDQHQHDANGAESSGGYLALASGSGNAPIWLPPAKNGQNGPLTFSSPPQPVQKAAAMVQAMTISFGPNTDHQVQYLGGGIQSVELSGSDVVCNVNAFIQDSTGHRQSDTNSSVTVQVYGIL